MSDLEQLKAEIEAIKVQYGLLDESDERIALALHMMSVYDLDRAGALDQTAREPGSHGIAGWAFDASSGTLHVLQGTLAESLSKAVDAVGTFAESALWLNEYLGREPGAAASTNPAIYNLEKVLEVQKDDIAKVKFTLVSILPKKELVGSSQFAYAEGALAKTKLNKWIRARKGRIQLATTDFQTERQGIADVRSYPIVAIADAEIALDGSPELRVRVVTLLSLVELLRRRGPFVFEKNVRMFLGSKKHRQRLEHPMQLTLDAICEGSLTPEIFPVYHGGVTISAADVVDGVDDLQLDTPSIVNGCQTVSIADRYLSQLEKLQDEERIQRFRSIGVIAKIVIRATDDQLREITNSNNRQNPIEAWQLFCNDSIHVEIELALRDAGIFYERQDGRFASLAKPRLQAAYPNTNGTFVKVAELARLIALCRRNLALAAKPSEVFESKTVHDRIFDLSVQGEPRDIVWASNCFKVVTRALNNYLRDTDAHRMSEHSVRVFTKPLIRAAVHHLCMLHLAQGKWHLSAPYSIKLNKIAPASLTGEMDSFLRSVVSRVKSWYLEESKEFAIEVPGKKLDAYVFDLAEELRLKPNGPMPLTGRSVDWESVPS